MNEAAFYCQVRDLGPAKLASLAERLRKSECECDSYHGYTCGKHWRLSIVEHFIELPTPHPPSGDHRSGEVKL